MVSYTCFFRAALTTPLGYRRIEIELNEKLQKLHDQLREAAQDSNETAKEAKMKDTLANLQRLFPGTKSI